MRFAFLLPLLCATSVAAAAPSTPDGILAALSRCDSGFFESLHRHAGELSSSTPHLLKGSGIATFKVVDRTDAERSLRKFNPPLKISDGDVFGYVDEYLSLGEDEAVVSWGFILRAPLATVIKATQSQIWDSSRLQQDGNVYTRSEQWDVAQAEAGWQKIDTPGGAESRPGTAERVLQIEAYEKDANMTRFACTLRGTVTRDLLSGVRPDLAIKAPGTK